jgi:DNA ligase-4
LTLHDVDALLDELATNSPFSNLKDGRISPRNKSPRAPTAIIKDLFLKLTSPQAAVMAQIILKDLTPILYPLPAATSHTALIKYNSNAFYRIECAEVMKLWHWALWPLSVVRSLDDAALMAENIPHSAF